MSSFVNEFSWSASRHSTFRSCPRKYYFNYYFYWNGWKKNSPPRVRRAYVLKNLKSRQMWAGTKVHEAIEHCLKNIKRSIAILPPEEATNITIETMRREYASSMKKRYLDDPKRELGLSEHHYDENISREKWQENADLVRRCLNYFYSLPLFQHVKTMPKDNFLEIENLNTFDFEGTKIWVSLDLFYSDGEKKIIVDWKTGKPSDRPQPMQLATYAIYAKQKYDCPADNLVGREINLAHSLENGYDVSEQETEHTKAEIRGSIADMKSLLKDPTTNEALDESNFALTENESACNFCNFKEICPRFEK